MRHLFCQLPAKSFVLVFLLLCAFRVQFATAQVYVGYCDSDAEIEGSASAPSAVATVSVAAAFTPDFLSVYANTSIKGIRFALYQNSGLKTMSVWLRNDLDGENLVEIEVKTTSLQRGWNSVSLPQLLDLDISRPLYLGITYSQTRRNAQIVGSNGEARASNSYLIDMGNGWSDQSSSFLPACLQLEVIRSTGHEFTLTELYVSANRYQEIPSVPVSTQTGLLPVECVGEVQNRGAEAVDGYVVTAWAQAGDSEPVCVFEGEVDVKLNYLDKSSFSFSFVPTDFLGSRNIRLTVETSWRDGSIDETPSDNVRQLYYDVVSSTAGLLQSKTALLVEQYVSLKNGWSVLGQQNVRQALSHYAAMPDSKPVCLLSHHLGYGPADSLRVTAGSDYSAVSVFGPEGLSYAPALSIGRKLTLSSTLPADSLLSAIQMVAQSFNPHTEFANLQILSSDGSYTLECDVISTSYTWCHNPVLIAALVQDEVLIAEGSQKDYGYEPSTTFGFSNISEFTNLSNPSKLSELSNSFGSSEQNVVVSYLTPSHDLSLIPGLSSEPFAEIAAIERGLIPSPEPGKVHFSIPFTLPASASPSATFHLVLWTCNMTSTDRTIDNSCAIELH